MQGVLAIMGYGRYSVGKLHHVPINSKIRLDIRQLSHCSDKYCFYNVALSSKGSTWRTDSSLLVFRFVFVRWIVLRIIYWCTCYKPSYASHKPDIYELCLPIRLGRPYYGYKWCDDGINNQQVMFYLYYLCLPRISGQVQGGCDAFEQKPTQSIATALVQW